MTIVSSSQPPTVRVAVVPASAHAARARLLAALESLYPVRFEARAPDRLADVDAVLCLGADVIGPVGVPSLVALGAEDAASASPRRVRLADDPALERVLRGALLHDAAVAPLAAPDGGATVLATVDDAPFWILRREGGVAAHVVAAAPDELGRDELLRERLVPGRCLALLSLTHFLRGLTAARDWRPPPLRAAFVLDDPNLHWPTYGHLRYRELLAHAARHHYHLAVAMIPLDAWLVHPRAARMFREGADRLSVQVHGNDHDGGELGRVRTDAEGAALAAQALRRIARFERRSGVHVARVMAPPHERVTEPALSGLLAGGFEAVSTARPYPWVEAQGPSWLIHPPGTDPCAVATPSHETPEGLPVVLRLDFAHPREELVLRAYLGQPLVVYGHHGDLADGLDLLAEAAGQINRLGEVRWLALDAIARGGVQTRVEGATLEVRPLARRIAVDVPAGIEEIRVVPGPCGTDARVVRWDGTHAGVCDLELVAAAASPGGSVRPRVRPLARRIATEGRDRLRAVI